eukprot:UN10320
MMGSFFGENEETTTITNDQIDNNNNNNNNNNNQLQSSSLTTTTTTTSSSLTNIENHTTTTTTKKLQQLIHHLVKFHFFDHIHKNITKTLFNIESVTSNGENISRFINLWKGSWLFKVYSGRLSTAYYTQNIPDLGDIEFSVPINYHLNGTVRQSMQHPLLFGCFVVCCNYI